MAEVEQPLFFRIITESYERLVVPSCVTVFVLHVLNLPPWKVYLLAPLTLLVSFTLIARFLLFIYQYGIMSTVWGWIRNAGRVLFGYGETVVNWVNANKFSRIIWTIAVLNQALILWYIYKNVDIFKILSDIYELFYDLLVYFSDPAKIMESLNQLLQRAKLLQLLKWFKESYLDMILEAIEKGDAKILVVITMMSVGLIVIGAVPSLILHFWR